MSRVPLIGDDRPPSYESVMRTDAQSAVVENIERDNPPTLEQSDQSNSNESKSIQISYMMTQTVGAGILVIPYSIACTGWSGLTAIIFLGFNMLSATAYTGRNYHLIQTRIPQGSRNVSLRPFELISQNSFGQMGTILILLMKQLTYFGVISVYLLISGDLLYTLMYSTWPNDNTCFWVFFLCCIITPIAFYGSPSKLWAHTSFINVFCITYGFGFIIYELLRTESKHVHHVYQPKNLKEILTGIGLICFSLSGPQTLPADNTAFKMQKKYTASYYILFFVYILAYLLIGTLSYLKLGQKTPINLLLELNSTEAQIAKWLLLIHFIISILNLIDAFFIPFEDFIYETGVSSLAKTIFMRLLGMIALGIFSLGIGNFLDIAIAVGLITIPHLVIINPRISYLVIGRIRDSGGNYIGKISRISFMFMIIVIITNYLWILPANFLSLKEIVLNVPYGKLCY